MKKITILTTAIFFVALILGILFRFNMWPGNRAMTTLGMSGLALISIPLLSIQYYKSILS